MKCDQSWLVKFRHRNKKTTMEKRRKKEVHPRSQYARMRAARARRNNETSKGLTRTGGSKVWAKGAWDLNSPTEWLLGARPRARLTGQEQFTIIITIQRVRFVRVVFSCGAYATDNNKLEYRPRGYTNYHMHTFAFFRPIAIFHKSSYTLFHEVKHLPNYSNFLHLAYFWFWFFLFAKINVYILRNWILILGIKNKFCDSFILFQDSAYPSRKVILLKFQKNVIEVQPTSFEVFLLAFLSLLFSLSNLCLVVSLVIFPVAHSNFYLHPPWTQRLH